MGVTGQSATLEEYLAGAGGLGGVSPQRSTLAV